MRELQTQRERVTGEPPAGTEFETRSPDATLSDSTAEMLSTTGDSTADPGNHYYRRVARIGMQVADALAYAHSRGILHRDIKPANLLLDESGNVWVADFGLVKWKDGVDLTHTGDIVGTIAYMAPERFKGWSEPRSDLYGLGITLYELLTLGPAFRDRSRAALIHRVLNERPVRPRKVDPQIPRDMETIVLKLIDREPGQRYQTAERVAEDLRSFLSNKPIHARRTPPQERLVLWCRRPELRSGADHLTSCRSDSRLRGSTSPIQGLVSCDASEAEEEDA